MAFLKMKNIFVRTRLFVAHNNAMTSLSINLWTRELINRNLLQLKLMAGFYFRKFSFVSLIDEKLHKRILIDSAREDRKKFFFFKLTKKMRNENKKTWKGDVCIYIGSSMNVRKPQHASYFTRKKGKKPRMMVQTLFTCLI